MPTHRFDWMLSTVFHAQEEAAQEEEIIPRRNKFQIRFFNLKDFST